MTPVSVFFRKEHRVFGLGSSGLATCAALKAGGAKVVAFDDQAAGRDAAKAKGFDVQDLHDINWKNFAALVLAPGVPLTHPEPHWTVKLAQGSHVDVIGDVELFCRERRAHAKDSPFAAITGTNGKSTTTALLAHVVAQAGGDAQVGGNLGTPILALEPPAKKSHSYNRVFVIPDRLVADARSDCRHSPEPFARSSRPSRNDGALRAVKERLVGGAGEAVVGVDDAWCRDIADRVETLGIKVTRISVERILEDGIFRKGERLILAKRGMQTEIASLDGIGSLRGAHNVQNAAAVFAAARALGLSPEQINAGFRSFPGLAHRMEELGRKEKVLFVNDSKATNADSAAKALSSFEGGIFWIAGGKAKEGGIKSLKPFFRKIAHAYLVGESAEAFAQTLEGWVPYTICGTLDVAVAKATEDALKSEENQPVVLLSPAAASFDQFRNFEIRGERFRELVRAIPGFKGTGKTA